MNAWVTTSNQICPGKLCQCLPIFLEKVHSISVFEVLKGNESCSKFRPKIPGELPNTDNEPVVIKPVEHAYSLRGNLHLGLVGASARSKAFKDFLS